MEKSEGKVLRELIQKYGNQTGFFGAIKTKQVVFKGVTDDFNIKFHLNRSERQIKEYWNTIRDNVESEDDEDEENM